MAGKKPILKKEPEEKEHKKEETAKKASKKESEKEQIGITVKKADDFSEWYQQAIIKSEFADYSAVSGCIVYRPELYLIWERIVSIVDKKLKNLGIKNSYFPMFIPERLLMKEATHLEGFSPEVAWVTHAGDKKLDEKLAIRPTSETIMYDSYSKWIKSWRDLPLRLAQWNNVVRWEFKHPVPLLRSREFLWVEGHTAFATKEEAEQEGHEIIKIWEDALQNYMATAFFTGRKSKKETFAGAEYTISLELVLPNGRAIQGPDFHHDGQIFAKAYDIKFLDKNEKSEYAFQNTWAITTRQLGVMIGIHGDDKGLVIPPRIAVNHVVIVPILFEKTMKEVLEKCEELKRLLSEEEYHDFSLGVILDTRNLTPGYKFNDWELKGVPVRIEMGPRDLENKQIVLVRRDTGEKVPVKMEKAAEKIKELLDDIQKNLFNKSKSMMESSITKTEDYKEFKKAIEDKKIVLAPYCNNPECEDQIKADTGAKALNSPLKEKPAKNMKCIACSKPAEAMFYFGKSY
ncbi:MAG: proline--tRNA ligase [Candidatus Woesearchaeota archaeon]